MILLISAQHSAGQDIEARQREAKSLQRLVDALRAKLGISAPVQVTIAERNARLVSVQPRDKAGVFALSFDREFLHGLDESDVRAAIAHELGHVWIFTHHPYLQTERLANDIARRAVSRESLLKVYEKVWAQGGAPVNSADFVGQ